MSTSPLISRTIRGAWSGPFGRSHKALVALVACALASIVTASVAWSAVGFEEDPDQGAGVNGPVWASAVVGDELWIGGEFTSARNFGNGANSTRSNVAVLDINTGELRDHAITIDNPVRAMASDGETIWIGGEFSRVDGQSTNAIIQWDPLTRTRVQEFSVNLDGAVEALRLHNGWLYIGGNFASGNQRNLIRVDPATGNRDNGFAPDPNGSVKDIAAAGNRIFVAGSFNRIGPEPQRESEVHAAAIDATTGAEVGIEIGGFTDVAQTIAVSSDGATIAVGDDNNDVTVMSSNGNRRWRQNGQGNIQALAILGDRVYVGLHDGWARDGDDRMLIAFNINTGAIDSAFDVEMSGFWGVRGLEVTPQGLVAVGEFSSIRGIDTRRVAIFRPVGAWTPAAPLAEIGDADGSGEVNQLDAQIILDSLAGLDAPDLVLRPADADGDGDVDLADAVVIAQQVSG